MEYWGNQYILKERKTAFLCSRRCPSTIILKSLDWAREKKNHGECVISGFHSQIEKDVFNILLRGKQSVIMVLARRMKKRWPVEIKKAVAEERLLVISPFDENVKRVTQETANKRNEIMVDLADEVFLAYAGEGGNLYNLMNKTKGKDIRSFE